jgi:DNA modification methylase
MGLAKGRLFDGVVTSPVYGNRMSDSHNAQDGSHRRSYTHYLGRKLTEGNIGDAYFWQPRYQSFHRQAWNLCADVTRPGGMMYLNVSDFIRNGEVVRTAVWHMSVLRDAGYTIEEFIKVETPRFRNGQNGDARVAGEAIIVGRKK